jgi:hypothetical protein
LSESSLSKRARTALTLLYSQIRPRSFSKFNRGAPSDQAAIDIFKGHWASKIPDHGGALAAGTASLFTDDPRPHYALRAFGNNPERIEGARVLELGPLEGGHTYQLEKLGADVLAIEGNAEGYLKCLIVKEIFDLKSRFLYGNFSQYLERGPPDFDLIFAAGVIYHMVEPLALIRLICQSSPRAFIWTHYYEQKLCKGFFSRSIKDERGYAAPHYRRNYFNPGGSMFWGGLASYACWLERDSLLDAFRHFGHPHIEIMEETPHHPNGPSFSFVTSAQPL